MGEVKHILLAKFKDDVSQEQIDLLIKGYMNLANRTKLMKSRRSSHQGLDLFDLKFMMLPRI